MSVWGEVLMGIISKPVEILTNWANEPLKKWEHDRSEHTNEAAHRRTIESQNAKIKTEADLRIKESTAKVELELRQKSLETDLNIKRETEINKVIAGLRIKENTAKVELEVRQKSLETDLRIKENAAKVELELRQKSLEADLNIKRETEIKKVITELDEWKKDQEIQRMERVSDAIMRYQEQLTKLNVNAISAIGHMQLELRERAQELVYDKTLKYKELQDLALKEAMVDLEKIESNFSNNEIAKTILIKAVDIKLSNIINTAQNFLIELNNDIKSLNQSINFLTERGQLFIESHLSHFHVAELPMNEIKMINEQPKINNHTGRDN